MVKSDPLKYLLTQPLLSGRLARWLLQLSKFDITCTTPTAIKSQAVIDRMTQFGRMGLNGKQEMRGDLPENQCYVIANEVEGTWTLRFNGSATATVRGMVIVLISPCGHTTTLSHQITFPCTNNITKYEAFLTGLVTARNMGIKKLKVIEDSNLVVRQMNGDFAVKELALAPYRAMAQRIIEKFEQVIIEHTPRSGNRYADALATLGSRLHFSGEIESVAVLKRDASIIQVFEEHMRREDAASPEIDWRTSVRDALTAPDRSLKELKEYVLLAGDLYKRLPGGVLARCKGEEEARRRMEEVHKEICGVDIVISLYRRL
ncbi:uncharacterized protein LOC112091006 [Morus notabilis]|uniref:uncharacterized protein LOC112091006 n=1 Tax=Morus notabilis TaxID=981085 RepID=UPI000CED06A0|nr:uncharacterized protein LOC112091006 [Morus notabilis]